MQYDLFQDDDIEALHIEISELKSAFGKLRRHYFAERNDLRTQIAQMREMIVAWKQVEEKKVERIPFFHEYIEVSN